MVTPMGPAVNGACGYATSANQFLRRTVPHTLRLRPLPRAAIPGRNRQGSRGRRARPLEAPSHSGPVPRGHVPNATPKPKRGPRTRVGRQPFRVRVHHLAGPDPRGHVPNADQGPTTGPPLGSETQCHYSEIQSLRRQRYVTGLLLQSTFVRGVPPRLPIPPVRPARVGPAQSGSREWHHGRRSRARRGSVVQRRPCSVRLAGPAGPRQWQGP